MTPSLDQLFSQERRATFGSAPCNLQSFSVSHLASLLNYYWIISETSTGVKDFHIFKISGW
jgi:hypothetical protein